MTVVRREKWFRVIGNAPELKASERFAAVVLGTTARPDGTHASMSARTLGREMAMSARSAEAYLKTLRECEYILQTKRGGRRGKKLYASIYSLTQPATQVSAWDDDPTRNGSRSNPQPGLRTPSPKGEERHRSAAREGSRSELAAQLEQWWPQAMAGPVEHLLLWIGKYADEVGCIGAARWLQERVEAGDDPNDKLHVDGWGNYPEDDLVVCRTLWLRELVVDASDSWPCQEDWRDLKTIDRALTAAMNTGLSLPEAAWCLERMKLNGGKPPTKPPGELSRLLTDKGQRTPGAQALKNDGLRWLDEARSRAARFAAERAARGGAWDDPDDDLDEDGSRSAA